MTLESNPAKPSYEELKTCFAPAGRDPLEELNRQAALVGVSPLLSEVLDTMPCMVMVLNTCRQIVAANATLLAAINKTVAMAFGHRPGEAVDCCHAHDGPDGCGTGPYCVACGAVHAILESQRTGGMVVRECRILTKSPEGVRPLELNVTARPIPLGGEQLLVVAAEDTSREKRLAVLQRAFFHDVLNTAGCLDGYARYLDTHRTGADEIVGRLGSLSRQLVDEIRGHRDLLSAESGELEVRLETVRSAGLLAEFIAPWLRHPAAEGRSVILGRIWDGTLQTDPRLVKRVLGNMLKNALEATPEGGTVTLDCMEQDDSVIFAVHNAEVMREDVQLQVFQRSFSTKGERGRGVGTYSMKLFSERYLGGRVDVDSREGAGTPFRRRRPKHGPG